MKKNALMLVLLSALVFSTTASFGQDWPKWMGPNGDGNWEQPGTIDKFPESGPKVVWRQPIHRGYSGPSTMKNRIYITDWIRKDTGKKSNRTSVLPGTERALCLDMKTGETVWSHEYECNYNIAYPNGPRCTPTIDGDRVYVLGAMGDLFCFERNTGKIIWSKKLNESYTTNPPFWGFSSHPMVDGEHLLLPVGGKGSAVVCFNKMTGDEIWKNGTSSDIAYAPLSIFKATPTSKERQLIFWHADGVHSFDPNSGKEFWFHKWPENKQQAQATTIVTPRFVGNQMLVSEFYRGSLLLEIGSNPPSVKEVYRTFTEDPRHKESLNALMVTPVVIDDLVYGISGMGEMRCHEWATGKMKWAKKDWLGKKAQLFATLFAVKNGDKYFMLNDLGELMIGKFSPDGYEELDRTKVLEPTFTSRGRTVVWAHPAFADGKMIARNDKEIICIDLMK